MALEQISKWARKYLNTEPKERIVVDEEGEIISELDDQGREILDPTPMAPPIGYTRQVPLHLQIREMVRSEALRQAAEAEGMETFEEADDFEVDDDFDPRTPFENEFDPSLREIREDVEQELQARSSSRKKDKSSGDQPDTVTEAAQPPESAERGGEAAEE